MLHKYFTPLMMLIISLSVIADDEPMRVWRFDTRDPVTDNIFEQGFTLRAGAQNRGLYHHVAENNPTRESPAEQSVYISTTSNRDVAEDQFRLIADRPGSSVSRGWIYSISANHSFFNTERSFRNAIDSGMLTDRERDLVRRLLPFYGPDDSSSDGSVFDEDEYAVYAPDVGIPYNMIESAQEIFYDSDGNLQFGVTVANPFWDPDMETGANPLPLDPNLIFDPRFPYRNPRGQINVIAGIATHGMTNAGYCNSYYSASSKVMDKMDFCKKLKMLPFSFPYE